jgi:hypothetical protein
MIEDIEDILRRTMFATGRRCNHTEFQNEKNCKNCDVESTIQSTLLNNLVVYLMGKMGCNQQLNCEENEWPELIKLGKEIELLCKQNEELYQRLEKWEKGAQKPKSRKTTQYGPSKHKSTKETINNHHNNSNALFNQLNNITEQVENLMQKEINYLRHIIKVQSHVLQRWAPIIVLNEIEEKENSEKQQKWVDNSEKEFPMNHKAEQYELKNKSYRANAYEKDWETYLADTEIPHDQTQINSMKQYNSYLSCVDQYADDEIKPLKENANIPQRLHHLKNQVENIMKYETDFPQYSDNRNRSYQSEGRVDNLSRMITISSDDEDYRRTYYLDRSNMKFSQEKCNCDECKLLTNNNYANKLVLSSVEDELT